jgi:HEXXH motif-containing protein
MSVSGYRGEPPEPPHHQLSRDDLIALAGEGGKISAVQNLIAVEYSKHLTFLWGVVDTAVGGEQYALARTGYDLLAAASRKNPHAAGAVVRHPSVGVWARRTIQAHRGGPAMPGAEPAALRAVGAAAAIRAGLRAEIELAITDGRVMLPSLGAALLPGSIAIVRSGPDHAEAGQVGLPKDPHRDAPGWLGLRRIRAGSLDVLVDDLDPFRLPDLGDLTPRTDTDPWDAALLAAWPVLERNHPGIAAEVAALVSVIVPRFPPPSGHGQVSTTSPEAFGAVGMSIPPDPVTGALTLAHEAQHLKLGALLDVVTLTLPDDGRLYYAPWRDDPRPIGGLLQGAYAHLGVSGFWRRQRKLPGDRRRADIEYARWREAAALAVETLRSSGRLTHAGLEFVNEMARTLGPWQTEPVPSEAMAVARQAAEAHQARWQRAHRPIAAE